MTYPFSYGFLVTDHESRALDPSILDGVVDELMSAMVARETDLTFDSSVGATLSRGEVEIEVAVAASDERAAAAIARDFVIESIRAIGGTPVGLFVFPEAPAVHTAHEWHERRAELASR